MSRLLDEKNTSLVTNPKGYKEFGKVVTKLTKKQLKNIISGKLPKGWRYRQNNV